MRWGDDVINEKEACCWTDCWRMMDQSPADVSSVALCMCPAVVVKVACLRSMGDC